MGWVGEPGLRECVSSSIFPVNPLPFLRERQTEGQESKQYHLSLQSKYHVTFFGEAVSRAWIPVRMLKNFQELSSELARLLSKLGTSVVRQETGFFL